MKRGKPRKGAKEYEQNLIIVSQETSLAVAIEDLLLIWAAS